MKRFFRLPALLVVLAVLLGALCVCGAEAVDAPVSDAPVTDAPVPDVSEPSEPVTLETEADDKNIIVNVTLPAAATPSPEPSASPEPVEPVEETVSPEPDPVYPAYSVAALNEAAPPADDTALSAVVSSLFGTYTPRTQTVTQYLPDGSSVTSEEYVPGVAGMDWPWIAGVCLFALVLFCFCKMLGGVLKHG